MNFKEWWDKEASFREKIDLLEVVNDNADFDEQGSLSETRKIAKMKFKKLGKYRQDLLETEWLTC